MPIEMEEPRGRRKSPKPTAKIPEERVGDFSAANSLQAKKEMSEREAEILKLRVENERLLKKIRNFFNKILHRN